MYVCLGLIERCVEPIPTHIHSLWSGVSDGDPRQSGLSSGSHCRASHLCKGQEQNQSSGLQIHVLLHDSSWNIRPALRCHPTLVPSREYHMIVT